MLLQVRSLNAILWFLLKMGLVYKQIFIKEKIDGISYVKRSVGTA
jgi:hypothetical protein